MQIPSMPADDSKQPLSSDLRSYYAQILGEYLCILQGVKVQGSPQEYFSCVNNIFTLTQHRLRNPQEISKIFSEVGKLGNEFIGVWKGQAGNCDIGNRMYGMIRHAERLLLSQMSEAGLFGEIKEKEYPI